MDEVLLESLKSDTQSAGKLMCEAYEHASNEVFKWHCEHPDLFPNEGVPEFAFNLDGGFEVGADYANVH